MFLEKVLLVTAAVLPLPKFLMAPPLAFVELPEKVLLVKVMVAFNQFTTAPPSAAEFPLKVQWVTVGELLSLNIPPPAR